MYIYLVRHGETDWNNKFLFQGHTDVPLNKTGLLQARAIGKELKYRKIDAIVSSDLKRAYQTANEIKKATGIKSRIYKMKQLRERNYGNLEGTTYDRYHKQNKSFTGEKDAAFFIRLNKAFKQIVKKFKGKDVVLVSHGGVVRQLVSYVIGLKDYKRLRIYNASLSEVFYDSKRNAFFLLLLNSVSHLPKKERNKILYHIKGV
ncbi:MAG: histidine phosphatase family protein [bacterium]